jgi:tetratricopeptide (TPR) repeat protein
LALVVLLYLVNANPNFKRELDMRHKELKIRHFYSTAQERCESAGYKSGLLFDAMKSFFKAKVLMQFGPKLCFLGLLLASPMTFGIAVDLSQIGDATHLELAGSTTWDYKVSREGNKIFVEVPKLEDSAIVELQNWSGSLIRRVELNHLTSKKDQIIFTVKNSKVKAFDYLTDQPSRLIVDFFYSDEKEPVVSRKPVAQQKQKPTMIKKGAKENTRKPAATEFIQVIDKNKGEKHSITDKAISLSGQSKSNFSGVFDGGDPSLERFAVKDYEIREEAIIKSQKNIYIRYPMLQTKSPYLNELLNKPPIYEIKAEETDENKKARLLLRLFEKKRDAVFIRTLKLFKNDYPTSKYDEILSYLEADVYYRLWQKDGHESDLEYSLGRYQKAVSDFPNSPLTERTELLIGYTYYEKDNPFGVLTSFERFLRRNKSSEYKYKVQVSLADSYLGLNKFDRALSVLNTVESAKDAGKDAALAAYKKGDVHFKMGHFEKALAEYNRAKLKWPGHWKIAPNAFYNSGETLFWLGKYKPSLDAYREFLQKFPNSEHGGYAMTRIGELLEILGAPQERVAGAYLECMFRFKASPGAGIANIRLNSDRMPRMKKREIEYALEKIDEFVSGSSLPHIKAFETLLVSDGFYKRKEFDKTLERLMTFYKENPNSDNLPLFRSRIVRTITTQISDLSEKGDFMRTFEVYGKNASTWLKDTGRIDILYYLGKSFEAAGVPEEASRVYRQALNKLYSIKGTRLGRERSVFEKLPSIESINLRVAATAVRMKKFGEAYKYLNQIKNAEVLGDAEKVERVELAATVAEQKGHVADAKKYLSELTKTWTGKPELVSKAFLRLARLQKDSKEHLNAEKSLKNILNLAADTNFVPEDIEAEAMALRAENFLSQKKYELAVGTYEELLEKYERKRPLSSVRYKAGKVLFTNGKIKEAEKMWAPLKEVEPKTWHKLAQEQLESLKFDQNYKKYIKRIPAMAGQNKGDE